MPQRRSAAGRAPEPRAGSAGPRRPPPSSLALGEGSGPRGEQLTAPHQLRGAAREHQPPRRRGRASSRSAIAETEAACVDLEREGERRWILRLAFPEHDSPPLRSAPVCFCWLLESSCEEWRERRKRERESGSGGEVRERGWREGGLGEGEQATGVKR